jgi:ribosomal protein S18 acetylase RimI-like enzyme
MTIAGSEIRRAGLADLDLIVPLFDAYRQFYRQPPDLEIARCFLLERLERNESVIFVAIDGDAALGFTQLYPSFSSVSLARIFVLNDLFVSPQARRRGVGRLLLEATAKFGRNAGATRLVLSTELTNKTAQSLYEQLGWKRDTLFCSYELPL